MVLLYFILCLIALIAFVGAALNVSPRLNLIAVGLAFWVGVPLIQFLTRL